MARPPRLTRQEFLRNKPVNPIAGRSAGQRYQSYLTAYQQKFGAPKTQVAGNALPTLSSLLSRVGQFETPAQLEARANRMANQGVTAQQTIIREEAKQMRDEALQRMNAMAAAGRAAAAQNAGLFGAVGGEYNAGAQEIRNLGTNLSGAVAGLTSADVTAQNASLGNIGAPDVAVGGPAGANTVAGPGQANVAAYQQGELPGQQIANAGQASQFGLAGMVSAQNLRATQEAEAAFNDSVRSADTARMSALKELAAGRPAQAAQFLQQLQDAQRQQIGLASGLIQQRSAMRQAGFEQGMTKKKYTQDVKQQDIQNKQTWAEIGMKRKALNYSLAEVDVERSVSQGILVNKRGQPIHDANGNTISSANLLKKVSGSSKTRSMTPGQKVRLIKDAQQFAENAFYGYGKDANGKRVPVTQLGDFNPDDYNTYGTGTQQYGAARQRLEQMGVPKAMATEILNGYYDRGEMGRPILSTREQSFLSKKFGPKRVNQALQQINYLLNNNQFDAADALISTIASGRLPKATAATRSPASSSAKKPRRQSGGLGLSLPSFNWPRPHIAG